MPKFTVPEECIGFEMKDGTKYTSRQGPVTVDNLDHERAIRGSLQKQRGQVLNHFSFSAAQGWDCENCGVSMFSWQGACVRCKRERPEEVIR